MAAGATIAVSHLCVSFGKDAALKDLSFSIAPGTTLSIVGESGSGKSLIALALMGLLPKAAAWSGTIDLCGLHMTPQAPQYVWQSIRGKVASLVFQNAKSALNPAMSIGKQLAEAMLRNTPMSQSEAKAAAIDWLRKVGISAPEKSCNKYPNQLSDAEKQRVMIAMAISAKPALLIADEAATALDVLIQADIIHLLKELQAEARTAIIFITSHPGMAAAIADEVLVMHNGEVLEQGPAAKVLTNAKALLDRRPGMAEKEQQLLLPMETKSEQERSEIKKLHDFPPLLKVRNLRVWFPTKTDWIGTPLHFLRAVEDVSFDLYKGEALGLIGANGSGKSTICRALLGLAPVESGSVIYGNKNLIHMSAADRRRMRGEVQMIFPDPYTSFNPRLTVGEAILEPLRAHRIVPSKEINAQALRLLDRVHLPANTLRSSPHQLSKEQMHRVGIARAIGLRPKLLICDESFSGLDMRARAQILNLLKDLQAELSLSVLFISHDLEAVRYVSDRLLVMQAGKIIERGSADEVFTRPQEPYTKSLIAAMHQFEAQ